MLIPKYRAILKARRIDGLYLPFSREPMVCRDTSRASASSSCLIPLSFRSSSSLFFISLLSPSLYGKFAFHTLIIHVLRLMSSLLSIFTCLSSAPLQKDVGKSIFPGVFCYLLSLIIFYFASKFSSGFKSSALHTRAPK